MKKTITFCIISLFAFGLWTSCSNSESSEYDNDIEEEQELSNSSGDIDEGPKSSRLPEEESSSSSEEVEFSIEGFVKQKGPKTVSLTDAADESNVTMKVQLDYDFYVGRTEVTREQYAALMGGDIPENEKKLPQVDVNFYDAVLYANALSKSEGRDTVYTYANATFTPSGSCAFLEGLATHYEVLGYRLPTEAEWVYVAKKFWDVENAWNADNSSSVPHEVCSTPGLDSSQVKFEENPDAVCNMTGNVAEWVDGWLADFKDTTLTNYVGASAPNSLKENMIKGGNCRLAPNDIDINTRRDVYPIAMNSSADYVGFRLVLGAIDKPLWLDPSGNVNTVKINIVATIESILATLNTRRAKAKLVFRNDVSGKLSFIDYTRNASRAIEIETDASAFHPDVSPNGNYVAFSTQIEGLSGKTKVYVCRLDSACSEKAELPAENAAIPRFRVLGPGDTALVYVSDAGSNKDSLTWAGYSTWIVPFAGGRFGSPRLLLKGSFNGGVTEGLAVTGSKLLRVATWDNPDKVKYSVWYNNEQACNVSLASDGSNRTLFLDFGSSTGQKFVGQRYGTHEQILVMDSDGKLVDAVASPAGYSYDHSEWVAGKNAAVATLTDNNGAHKKIVLIDMGTKKIVELVESDELWHPVLWVERSTPKASSSSVSVPSSSSEIAKTSSSSEIPPISSSSKYIESSSSSDYIESSSSGNYIESSSSSEYIESCSSSEYIESSSSSGYIESSSSSEYIVSSSSSEHIESSSSSDYIESSSSSGYIESSSSNEHSLVLDLDSAGIYVYSNTQFKDFIIRYKMELLWQFADSANVIVIGSSRPLNAVFPTRLSSKFTAVNLGLASCTIHMSKDLLMKYIMPHFKKMKYLVVSLDLDFWWKTPSGKDDNWFADDANAKYLLYPGFVYDRNHDYWAGEEDLTPLYEATKEGILYSSNRTDNIIELRGQLHTTCAKSWPGASFGATISDPGQEIIRGSMNSLKTIIEESAKRGVTVIGTILPQSPAYKGSKYFGYLGMSRSIADSLIGEFTQMQNTYSNFVLFDENKGGEHDYAGGMNEDAQHLCDEGAKIYTQRLDSLLLELDSNP